MAYFLEQGWVPKALLQQLFTGRCPYQHLTSNIIKALKKQT